MCIYNNYNLLTVLFCPKMRNEMFFSTTNFLFSFPFVVVKNPPRVQFYAYSAETHKYGRCFLYSFFNVASSFAERAIRCIARAVSVPERVARVRSYLRVGRRPTDLSRFMCDKNQSPREWVLRRTDSPRGRIAMSL